MEPRKRSGPPMKLNDAMITALSEAIAKGLYHTTASRLCGLNDRTMYAWLQRASEDREEGIEDSIYIRLENAIRKAEAEAEARLVAVVREAAEVKREWLPAMTMLERRHPDRWGRRDRTQIDISEKREIKITHVEVVLPSGVVPEILGESTPLNETLKRLKEGNVQGQRGAEESE